MKFKHLLSLAMALMIGVQTYAQSWTSANDGIYMLYNVDAGTFLTRAGSWGTQAVLRNYGSPVKVATNAEGVTTFTFTDSKQTLFADNETAIYCDNTKNNGWTLDDAENGAFYIKNIATSKYILNKDGVVTTDGDNKDTWKLIKGDDVEAIYGAKKLNMMKAVFTSAGVDVSGMTSEADITGAMNYSLVDVTSAAKFETSRGESWQPFVQSPGYKDVKTFTVTIPESGIYKIQIPAMYRISWSERAVENANNGVDYACVTLNNGDYSIPVATITSGATPDNKNDNSLSGVINGQTVYFPNGQDGFGAWAQAGYYLNTIYYYAAESGTTKITLRVEMGNLGSNGQWCVWNPQYAKMYKLQSKDEVEALKNALSELITEAKGITGIYETAVKNALATAISAAESAVSGSDANLITTEQDNLAKAMSNAKASINEYISLKGYLDELAKTNVYSAEGKTFYDNLQVAYDNKTYETAAKAGIKFNNKNAEDFWIKTLQSAWTIDGGVNLTRLYQNTWSVEADGKENSSELYTPFFEYWVTDGQVLSEANIAASVEGLTSGKYKVEAKVRVRISDSATSANGITLTANNGVKNVCAGTTPGDGVAFRSMNVAVPAIVGEDGKLDIKFAVASDNTCSWLSFKAVKYSAITEAEYDELNSKSAEEIAALWATRPTTPMNAGVKSDMDNAKATLDASKSATDYEALSAAIAKAQLSADAYSKLYDALSNNTLDEAGSAKYQELNADIFAAYTNGTIKDADCAAKVEEALANLATATKVQTTDGADMTGAIINNSFETGNLTGWTATRRGDTGVYPQSNGTYATANGDGAYLFNTWNSSDTSYDIKQTLTEMPAGIYTLKALVATNDKVTLNANNYSVEKSHTEHLSFVEATLENIVLLEKGNLTISLTSSKRWFKADNFRLTLVSTDLSDYLVTEEDKAALAEAIATAEAKLGFAAGECAPYTNINAVKALTAAKNVNVNEAMKADVVAATTALNNASWIVNTVQVNAIYDGDFTQRSVVNTTREAVEPTGWTNWGDNLWYTRVYNSNEMDKNTLAEGAVLMSKTETSYGEIEGYTMPLKPGVYSLEFKYGGFNQTNATRDIYLTCGDIKVVPVENTGKITATCKNAEKGDEMNVYSSKFIITEAGNYVLNLYHDNNQNQMAYSKMSIMPVPETNVSLSVSAAKYGTFIAPFEVEVPEGVTAGTATVNGTTIVLTEVADGKIPANTPVVLYSENVVSESFSGQSVALKDSYSKDALTGVYTSTPAPVGSYVLQMQGEKVAFYVVGASAPTVGANRCYLTLPTESSAKMISFPSAEETAISAVSALTSGAAEIYSANGTRVNGLQKGVNIVKTADGKTMKIMVK